MSDGKLVQIADARREKQERLKRDYERVLFNRVLGSYTYVDKLGLRSVEMVDISKSGCSFRMPIPEGAYAVGEEVDFRFYFSNSTFLPCRLTVRRATEIVEDNGLRYWLYGCTFDDSLSTYPVIERFVEFINAYAAHAKEDKGDKQVWYL